MTKFNRRDFLKFGAASIIGSGLSHFPRVAFANSHLTDYKALVCVFLHGGNDGFNLIVPNDTDGYSEYANSRQNLAIAQNTLLPISPLSNDGHTYGLHPQAAPLQSLFAEGKMSVMANVGNLLEPFTRTQIENGATVKIPTELFSHNNQQDQWKTINIDPSSTSGWGGRLANIFAAQESEPLLTGLSINSRSLWLRHPDYQSLSISSDCFDDYWFVGEWEGAENKRRTAYLEMLFRNYNNVFHKEIADTNKRTLELVESVGSTLSSVPSLSTVFPDDGGYGLA